MKLRHVFRASFLAVAFLVTTASIWAQQSSVPVHVLLWPHGAPLATGAADADIPSLDVYLPASNPTHTGIVICPGGGYRYLALDKEGTHIAQWLVQHGVAAFVLHYRVAPYRYPVPMLDGERAIRLVRLQAGDFGVAPDHIGVWGFSAGGHVASFLMTQFNRPLLEGTKPVADAADRLSARPDFGILAYPVISLVVGITHAGSRENLIGDTADMQLAASLSNELNVGPNSPPAFIFATSDDPIVPIANSVLFYQAYTAQHLPIEMHLFEHGPHGVALAERLAGASVWSELLANWMQRHGWMVSAAQPTP